MKLLVAALTSALLIGSSYATAAMPASSAPDAATPTSMPANAQRDVKVENHIKDLHAKLKITAAEEPQWATVAKAMHDNADQIDTVIDKRETLANPTAIDDLNAYGDIAQAHADGVKKLATAFAPLYTAMSDAQKKVADSVFVQRPHDGKHASTASK